MSCFEIEIQTNIAQKKKRFFFKAHLLLKLSAKKCKEEVFSHFKFPVSNAGYDKRLTVKLSSAQFPNIEWIQKMHDEGLSNIFLYMYLVHIC